MHMADIPSLRSKLFFWFILSAFSVFFAEVVSGSSPLPFFNPFNPADIWGWIALMPLYGLHTIVLASVVFSGGKPRFYALFLAGAIFGLYEAYITKVLWHPGWGAVWTVGGVAVVELVVIAFFWHPFMSFIIPLTAGETVLTGSREIVDGMPAWMRRWLTSRNIVTVFILFAVWAGLTHGGTAPSMLQTFLSCLISAGFLLGLVHVWKKRTGAKSYSMRSLLPTRTQLAALMVPLLAIYIVFGAGILPQRIPGLFSQAVIWAIYGILFTLLYLAIRRTNTDLDPVHPLVRPRIGWKWMLAFFGVFSVSSVVWNPTGLSVLVLVLSWFPAIFIGLYFLSWSAKEALAGMVKINKRGDYPVPAQGATGR